MQLLSVVSWGEVRCGPCSFELSTLNIMFDLGEKKILIINWGKLFLFYLKRLDAWILVVCVFKAKLLFN